MKSLENVVDRTQQLPQFLYKYQAPSDYAFQNLAARSTWCSKPISFNDPFDCAIQPPSVPVSEEEWTKLFIRSLELAKEMGPSAPGKLAEIFWKTDRPTEAFKESYLAQCREFYTIRRDKHLNELGVACFSEHKQDLLLWSHYAQGHSGFCLEFDTSYEPFPKAEKVQYSDSIPGVSPVALALDLESVFRVMLMTKASCWRYEEEWRLLNQKGNCLERYDPKSLTAVYLGVKMSEEHARRVQEILRGSPTRVYQMAKSVTKFELSWNEVGSTQ